MANPDEAITAMRQIASAAKQELLRLSQAYLVAGLPRTLADGTYLVACGLCQGRGLLPYHTRDWQILDYWDDTACHLCRGKGLLRVQVVDLPIPDARCQGSGLARPTANCTGGRDERCPTCYGSGVRSLTGEVKLLPL
jgi:DnaJ-class molecular chaperone